MRNKLRTMTAGLALSALLVLGVFAGTTSAGADHCGALSEGENQLAGFSCYTFQVPEGVDVLRMTFGGEGRLNGGCTFQQSYPPGYSDDSCAIPGPGAGSWTLRVYRGPGPVWVEFKEAQPVNIAGTGWLWQPTDGAMFRFDGLESAAVLSVMGGPDLSLRVRRGTPPTQEVADCVSDVSLGDTVPLTPGVESCRLDAGIGPIYAFVRNRTFSACVRWDPYGWPLQVCAEETLEGLGNGSPGPPELWHLADYETYAYSFLVSGVGA